MDINWEQFEKELHQDLTELFKEDKSIEVIVGLSVAITTRAIAKYHEMIMTKGMSLNNIVNTDKMK